MTTVDSVLSAHGLYKIFGKSEAAVTRALLADANAGLRAKDHTIAVKNVSFDVAAGEIFVVMGLSGSGKSTLIRMLNGLLKPSAGSVKVFSQQITSLPIKELRRVRQTHISMVFQHFALLPHQTVLENVAFGLQIKGSPRAEREERAAEVIALVGLSGYEHSYPDELSGGMRQRVGLARALAADTDILLMDEAFSALDPLIRREMQEELIELQAKLQKTIIFITHDLNEAMFLGDRIAVMRAGEVVQIGTPEQILTEPADDYVAQFVQDVDRARVVTAGGAMMRARAISLQSAGIPGALKVMRNQQVSSVLVVDRRGRLIGGLRDREVISAVQSGVTDLAKVLHSEVAQVDPDAVLSELVELSVDSDYDLAVTGTDGKLLGVIPRVTLLAALGNVPPPAAEANELDDLTVPVEAVTDAIATLNGGTGTDA